MASAAAPSASVLAAASLGAGIVLLLQQTPCCSSGARGGGAASPAKRAHAGLVVERLGLGDAAGRQFVLDGFRGIQAAEGRSWEDIPDEEIETIATSVSAASGSAVGSSAATAGPVWAALNNPYLQTLTKPKRWPYPTSNL